jgi:hypothetical protein
MLTVSTRAVPSRSESRQGARAEVVSFTSVIGAKSSRGGVARHSDIGIRSNAHAAITVARMANRLTHASPVPVGAAPARNESRSLASLVELRAGEKSAAGASSVMGLSGAVKQHLFLLRPVAIAVIRVAVGSPLSLAGPAFDACEQVHSRKCGRRMTQHSAGRDVRLWRHSLLPGRKSLRRSGGWGGRAGMDVPDQADAAQATSWAITGLLARSCFAGRCVVAVGAQPSAAGTPLTA